jgi:hypothetical protein
MRNYGYSPSIIDGTEEKFEPKGSYPLPKKYSYKNYMSPVLNQGSESICVPCSIACYVDWKSNMKDGTYDDNKTDKKSIYDIREDKSLDGMTIKEALEFLKKDGVQTKDGIFKIKSYATIGGVEHLKYSLVINGPSLGGLMVKCSDCPDFWNGYENIGGHCISIVGYDETGFEIRNSWGKYWGYKGYSHMNYEDFNKFMEVWTIID